MSTIQTQYGTSQDTAETLRSQKQQKEELQASHEREIDSLKRSYAAEKESLQDRFESGAQAERLAHYEHLRNLKAQMNREERHLEKLGRESLRTKSDGLRNEELSIEKEGRIRVDDARRKAAAIGEYERQRMSEANQEVHQNHVKNTRLLMEESEAALEGLREQQEKFVDARKQMHGESLRETEEQFKALREEHTDRLRTGLAALEAGTRQELNRKTLEAGERISRFENEKSDPFYQLKRFDSEIREEPDAYRITVKIPDHERKHLRIQATPHDIQLIGVRTAEREASAEGRTLTSRSHQTISEKFNLSFPIDVRSVTRQDHGDSVQFILPKVGPERNSTARSAALEDPEALSRDLRFGESLPTPGVSTAKTTRGSLG